jgi:hypothetical protein
VSVEVRIIGYQSQGSKIRFTIIGFRAHRVSMSKQAGDGYARQWGEVMTDSEDDSDEMPELVNASDDDGVEYPVDGESLVARRALNTQIKIDDMELLENIFHTRCFVNNKVC